MKTVRVILSKDAEEVYKFLNEQISAELRIPFQAIQRIIVDF